jgi:predicted secreted protein
MGEPDFEPDSDALGSGGKVTLRFEAAAPGQTVLHLDYYRPFEAEEPPLQTFEVTVQVSE